MNLQEIFNQLTYGELSQLAIGGGEAGVIAPANYDRVLAHVNLGLTALHKRFKLREGKLRVELVTGRTEYPLLSKYAVSSRTSREATRYIKDSAGAPFRDDILKVEKVKTADGVEFSLNDEADPYGIFTPSSLVLRVPEDVVAQAMDLPDDLRTSTLDVFYRANHPAIAYDGADLEPERVEIDLPVTHLEPLLLFVASRAHTPVGMSDNGNTGNLYLQKYEMACKELELLGLEGNWGGQWDKLRDRGWV